MGGFPLGDLWRWWNSFPTTYSGWKAQAATERAAIQTMLATGVTDVAESAPGQPTGFDLSQNYPNPFNPSTRISYTLPASGQVSLKVFNLLGMEVASLASGIQEAGQHEVVFDGTQLASGVYFYRLTAANVSLTRKMVFMK